MYKFKPEFKLIGKYNPILPAYVGAQTDLIKNEPMLFSCDIKYALANGGSLTRDFIEKFIDTDSLWEDCIIDSRVHMLMPNWYPCIPGWHHDDIARNTASGQPNYDNPPYEAWHRMMVFGDTAMPEFITCETEMPKVEDGKIIYKVWNDVINEKYPNDKMAVESGDVYEFGPQDFHRGIPGDKHGWRFFIRATRNSERVVKNEIRRQVQVYLPEPEAGW